MPDPLTITLGTATCPSGFQAGGVCAGLRRSGKPDLALFLCPKGASAAGVFTQNIVRAAPVDISEQHLKSTRGRARAVLINSGFANAATGEEGRKRADRTVSALASMLDCPEEETLVASTGVIGQHLPDDRLVAALPALKSGASAAGLMDAANAILTTDTCVKAVQCEARDGARAFRVAGVAKGSGMIHPNMATMLGVVLTDAQVAPHLLQTILRDATSRTFNRISVDGDTSTNDCVFALASGEAGSFPEELVRRAIERVCRELALMIVRDGEGAKKVIHVRVSEASTGAEALRVAETVAGSLLVRTAVAGGDPNWGRILAAVGRSGVKVDPERVSVFAGGVPLFEHGAPASVPREKQKQAFMGADVELEIKLAQGDATEEFFTCDLTEGYIRINADYTT